MPGNTLSMIRGTCSLLMPIDRIFRGHVIARWLPSLFETHALKSEMYVASRGRDEPDSIGPQHPSCQPESGIAFTGQPGRRQGDRLLTAGDATDRLGDLGGGLPVPYWAAYVLRVFFVCRKLAGPRKRTWSAQAPTSIPNLLRENPLWDNVLWEGLPWDHLM